MPFLTTEDFKLACHSRANGVALLTASKPELKVTVVTEHAAAFPHDNTDECYVTVIIKTASETYKAVKESDYFALNYLRRSQRRLAEKTYELFGKEAKKIKWDKFYNVPYLPSANAAVISSVKEIFDMGANKLVIGHVMGVYINPKQTRPLVNYNQTYCGVIGPFIPVRHPSQLVHNTRLTTPEDTEA